MKDTVFEIVEWDHSRKLVKVLDVKYATLPGFDDLTDPDDSRHIVTMAYPDGVTHEVTLAYFKVTLMARKGSWDRWKMLTAPKVTAARIAPEHNQPWSPMLVYGTVEGKEVVLLKYFSDELSFSPGEFVGKTVDQAREIHSQRDIAYLRS